MNLHIPTGMPLHNLAGKRFPLVVPDPDLQQDAPMPYLVGIVIPMFSLNVAGQQSPDKGCRAAANGNGCDGCRQGANRGQHCRHRNVGPNEKETADNRSLQFADGLL